jgi:hypothetical protein
MPDEIGESYLRFGDLDHAFFSFNHAVDQRCIHMVMLVVDPVFDSIRSDSRYRSLLRRLNLEDKVPLQTGSRVQGAPQL